MEIIIWVSERKERGRERRQDDSKHDQIEFLFALAHGRNIDRRKAAGMARKEKKNSERERERESAGRLKAREDLSSNGSKDRYSRSATNHFDEVTKISPFPSSLPVSLSLPFSNP